MNIPADTDSVSSPKSCTTVDAEICRSVGARFVEVLDLFGDGNGLFVNWLAWRHKAAVGKCTPDACSRLTLLVGSCGPLAACLSVGCMQAKAAILATTLVSAHWGTIQILYVPSLCHEA